MYLDTVVCILVGIFRIHTFCQRSKAVGQFCITFLFLTFFRSQLAFTGNVIQGFVDVHVTRSLIQQRTACIQFCLDGSQHVIHSREFDNCLAELLTVFCVRQSLIISSLAQTYRLSGNTQAGTVHQRHDVFNQT